MAEPENATRAPESDAMEGTIPARPTVTTQSQSGMGEHCTSDRPTSGQPSGEMTKFGDIEVYISKPADYPNTPGKLLLMLTGGTGVHSTNNQVQADKWATQGFVVIMPDQFSGDPAPNSSSVPETPISASILDQIKLRTAETVKSFMLDMWLARQTPEKIMPIIHKILEHVKDEYADAIAHGGGVYAVGYCNGGKFVITLAGQHPDTIPQGQVEKDEESGTVSKGPLIKAGAVAHATLVTRDDMTGIIAPLTLVCVENDPLFPDEILEVGKQHLEKNNVLHEIKTYPNVPHGFAVVGDYESASIKESQIKAFQQMCEWLKSH